MGHPVLLRVPDILTGKFDFYLGTILPAGHTGHVFMQREGKPRQDFSSATRATTKQLIGRAVNAHQFPPLHHDAVPRQEGHERLDDAAAG